MGSQPVVLFVNAQLRPLLLFCILPLRQGCCHIKIYRDTAEMVVKHWQVAAPEPGEHHVVTLTSAVLCTASLVVNDASNTVDTIQTVKSFISRSFPGSWLSKTQQVTPQISNPQKPNPRPITSPSAMMLQKNTCSGAFTARRSAPGLAAVPRTPQRHYQRQRSSVAVQANPFEDAINSLTVGFIMKTWAVAVHCSASKLGGHPCLEPPPQESTCIHLCSCAVCICMHLGSSSCNGYNSAGSFTRAVSCTSGLCS